MEAWFQFAKLNVSRHGSIFLSFMTYEVQQIQTKHSILADINWKLKINGNTHQHRQRQNIMFPIVPFEVCFCWKCTMPFFWKMNLKIILSERSQGVKKQHLHNSLLADLTSKQKLKLRKENKPWPKSSASSFSDWLQAKIALKILKGCTDWDEILVWCDGSMEIIAISYICKA